MKKTKWINIIVWGGLALLVLVVIITSIILHAKRQKLEDLKDKNEAVSPESSIKFDEEKIFLKNIEIFLDKELFF